MIDFNNIEGFYFVGIGGIGMSALALYFLKEGYTVAGFDRSAGKITRSLEELGCPVAYEDNTELIPVFFREIINTPKIIIVYTPAVPADNRILGFFRANGYSVYKRSEILGGISASTNTLAVAGTHGKTTVSTMIAHILKQSHVDCSAFLGGISKNYDSNLLTGESEYTVMEADEFDRSFLRLKPLIAVITSLDADHLDIYGDRENMVRGYNEFCTRIRPGGKLVVNSRIKNEIIVPEGIECSTYGTDPGASYHPTDIKHRIEYYSFNIVTPSGVIGDIHFPFPGIINIENFTAAAAVALMCGVTEEEIRKAALIFRGVRRRFDIKVSLPGITYIDDYAHHPEEIRAFILSVKEYFGERRICAVFQPHLYSRTRDHADGFASVLDQIDEVILLPVYPAREKPIPGITSEIIFERMRLKNKRMLDKEDIPGKLDLGRFDVLLTIGAGDIDTLVEPIEQKILKTAGR
jgi:UDP-N-acetylmuramate--alanine ligase